MTALGVKADFYPVFIGADGVLRLIAITRLCLARLDFVNRAVDAADTFHGVGNSTVLHATFGAVCNMPKRTTSASGKSGAIVILSVGRRRNNFLNFRNRIFFINLYYANGKGVAQSGSLYKNSHALGMSNAGALGGYAVNRYRN